jgi:GNAT superfamily N-acetyltransferase
LDAFLGCDLEIRVADRDDYQAYNRLIIEVDALHAAREPRYFQVPEPSGRPRDYYDSILKDPAQIIFLAVLEGAVVGQIHLEIQDPGGLPILAPRKAVRVADIVVTPAFQRRGVGRALMQRAKLWAKERGAQELALSVRAFNKGAMKMYLAEGFQVVRSVMALPLDNG